MDKPIVVEKVIFKEPVTVTTFGDTPLDVMKGDVVATVIFNGEHYRQLVESDFCFDEFAPEIAESLANPAPDVETITSLTLMGGDELEGLVFDGPIEELKAAVRARDLIEFRWKKKLYCIQGESIITFMPEERAKLSLLK